MEYYIYIYLNPLKPGNYNYKKFRFEFEPFYIGLGKKNRINQHINESKYSTNKSIKDNIILKILKNDIEPIRFKLYENLTLERAIKIEKYLIKIIGRRDLGTVSLSNLTEGGEGGGFISDRIKNKIKNTIGKNRVGEKNANYGKKWTDEMKRNASIRQKETHKHFIGENNPAKDMKVRKKLSEDKMGEKNPNAKKWLLVSPNNDEFIINGGIKRNLKKYNLTYSMFEYYKDNEKRKTKNNWILKEI
jgi:hypothetical protein